MNINIPYCSYHVGVVVVPSGLVVVVATQPDTNSKPITNIVNNPNVMNLFFATLPPYLFAL